MTDESWYGRNRQSVVEIDEELHDMFKRHPECQTDDEGELSLPAQYLPDIFTTFENHFGSPILNDDEMAQFDHIIQGSSEGITVGPQMLLALIAARTGGAGPSGAGPGSGGEGEGGEDDRSPPSSPELEERDLRDLTVRGRLEQRAREYLGGGSGSSRSSSQESNGTAAYRSRPPSRSEPRTPNGDSPFDVKNRQRTTPLKAAPSSWTRPAPPRRRRSDASSHARNMSDSESASAPPISFNRTKNHSRRPSNGASSSHHSDDGGSNIMSPPHSRPQSRVQSRSNSFNDPFESPTSERSRGSPPHALDLSNATYDSYNDGVNTLPMPGSGSDDSDDDDDAVESALGLVMDRSSITSIMSMTADDRIELMEKVNKDLDRKLKEAEVTLMRKLSEHEAELEEIQVRLEESKSELTAAKKEEKELKNKERSHTQQISILESEIAKVHKTLDAARSSYSSLQRQYQEQLAQSEELRNTMRRKDQEIHDYKAMAQLNEVENAKWVKEQAAWEDRISALERELAIANAAQATLEEQKHENMMLKETIDRMRFDMDELRNGMMSAGGNSGVASARNSVIQSKTLGAELTKMMDNQWGMREDSDEEEETSTMVNEEEDDSDTEGEDIVQTIITRTKRGGKSKANRARSTTIETSKEYANAWTQHDPTSFVSNSSTQTIPAPTVSLSIQTTPPPTTSTSSTQSDAPVSRSTSEMEIQTDEPEPTPRSRSPTPETEESMASSSTVQPPTPKGKSPVLPEHPTDLPPSYNQVTSGPIFQDLDHLLTLGSDDDSANSFSHVTDPTARRDLRIAAEVLKKYHAGLHLPVKEVKAGVTEDAIEDWKSLKEELGVECSVIDKLLEISPRTESSRSSSSKEPGRRRSRFYNIYNTYVYGKHDGADPSSSSPSSGFGAASVISHVLIGMTASAAMLVLMSPFLNQQYVVPGGPTYYDRAAWTSFNSMHVSGEGFANEGTTVVWHFLGRLGGGAARIARGWPT